MQPDSAFSGHHEKEGSAARLVHKRRFGWSQELGGGPEGEGFVSARPTQRTGMLRDSPASFIQNIQGQACSMRCLDFAGAGK